MVKPRLAVKETGIQDKWIADEYDKMMKKDRDKGILYTNDIIKFGILNGSALEIGPGPGYLGLEWLLKTDKTILTGIDVSEQMIYIAGKNAKEYGFSDKKVKYVMGDAHELPFNDKSFDGVFSNATLHELADPVKVFNEIFRVLKSGGRYYISDLRRNMNPVVKYLMKRSTESGELISGLISSIKASYTKKESENLIMKSNLKEYKITTNPFSIFIKGIR